MCIEMNQPQWCILPQGLENRVGNRMVSTNRQRPHSLRFQLLIETLDVLERLLQAVATPKRDVADISSANPALRNAAKRWVVGSDALDGPDGARPEPRAGAIGDAQVHGHADGRDFETSCTRGVREPEKRRHAGIRQ